MVVSSFSKKNISSAPKQTMPQLGLVCITVSQAVRFKTVTRKRLQQMSISEQSQKLRSLYKENLQRLNGAIDFCNDRDIRLTNYDHPSVARILAKARTTWPDPNWQLVHISNERESLHDPRHSDLISVMPDSFWQAPWIEVEAKHKEEAIAKLQQEWLSSGEL